MAVFVCHGSFEDQVHLVVAHLVLRTATGEVEIEHLRRALNFFWERLMNPENAVMKHPKKSFFFAEIESNSRKAANTL